MWKTIFFTALIISSVSGHEGSSGVDAGALQMSEKEDDQRGGPDWQDLGSAQQLAAEEGKIIMIFFEAEWCGICRRLESEVFTDPDVLQKLRTSYLPVMIDVDLKSLFWFNGQEFSVRLLAQQFNVSAVPTLLFVDETGEAMAHQTGFIPAEELTSLLAFIKSESFGLQSFEEYKDHQ